MENQEAGGVEDFYNWSREYWIGLSSDPLAEFAGLLNFGCWDAGAKNLYTAQLRLFDLCTHWLHPLDIDASGLEIGCGLGGNSTRLCANNPIHMTAMDVSTAQLDIARQRAESLGFDSSRVRFVNGSSMNMPFADDFFDFSICIESSFHYPELDTFVAEQKRILKPGAKAVIADITCEDDTKIRFRQGNYFYSTERMIKLLENNGLEVVSLQNIGPHVFNSLYAYACSYNQDKKSKLSKYWNLVLSNYASLFQKGLMGYHIFEIQKPSAK